MPSTKLSPNFALVEFLRSAKGQKYGVDNTPSPTHLANLFELAATLEEVRKLLGHPVVITSGYRSERLNKLVDGSLTSSHSQGLAADFHCPGFGSDLGVCRSLEASDLRFDQLIFEQTKWSTWVHLGIGQKMRREVLSWKSGKGYQKGLVVL